MSDVRFTRDLERVLYHAGLEDMRAWLDRGEDPPAMEAAGPRETLFFDPSRLACGIVTCGGLCPGLNHDSAFCLLFGHCAVHAGMSGRTNMVVSFWNSQFAHVPISLAVSQRKKIGPEGPPWSVVLVSTGQPRECAAPPSGRRALLRPSQSVACSNRAAGLWQCAGELSSVPAGRPASGAQPASRVRLRRP
jgi:hypothetical protein